MVKGREMGETGIGAMTIGGGRPCGVYTGR